MKNRPLTSNPPASGRDRACAIVALLALSLLGSCSKESQAPVAIGAPGATGATRVEAAVPNPVLVPDGELKGRDHPRVLGFTPAFVLKDQDGKSFSSDRLIGKPWVANFMFTRCPTTCPLQTALLRRLQDRIKEQQNADGTHLVSFSVDPGNDSPEVLKKYAHQAGADDQMWKFLTGSVDEIRDTITREGFKLAVEVDESDPNAIQHSSMFVLVDSYQRVRGLYQSESPQVINELMTDLAALKAEIVNVPPELPNPEWMETREREQMESAETIRAFHDFSFSDERAASQRYPVHAQDRR
jgi:cytochrome oxidase Cu insertion factor (SCO1/SenC/PrrC family)